MEDGDDDDDDDDDDVLLSFRLPSTGRVGGETTRRQMKRK